jgi:hypothetical protein
VNGIIGRSCKRLGLRRVIFNGPRAFDGNLPKAIKASDADFLCYGNAGYHHVQTLGSYRAFHMVRDPRDIAVSAYFSHKHSHKIREGGELTPDYRQRLQSLDKEAGLLRELERRASQFRQMAQWNYEDPNILEVRFEDVTKDPNHWFRQILGFLGILADASEPGHAPTLAETELAQILEKVSFATKSGGRSVGDEDVHNHYRKGVSGDWANHFGPAHVEYFKAHYNDVLLKLGYETQPDW